MSRRTRVWLALLASDFAAYALVFWDAAWPSVRYVAGWYVIAVTILIAAAAIITLSIKWGPVQYRIGVFDYLTLW
jgi:hypothetical protein